MRYIALDCETSGFDHKKEKIVQLAAIEYTSLRQAMLEKADQKVKLRGFSTLLNPGKRIPVQTSDIHGITDSMVSSSPRFEHIAEDFLDLCKDAILVGHNLSFDIRFINSELARCGMGPLDNETIDTYYLAKKMLPGLESYKLEFLNTKYSLYRGQSHDALNDAIACAKLECYINIFNQNVPDLVY